MLRSIRWRIAIPYIILILIITFGVGVFLNGFIHRQYAQQAQDNLIDQAQWISASLAEAPFPPPSQQTLEGQLAHWSSLLQARITILTRDGTVVGDSDQDPQSMGNLLQLSEIQEALEEGKGHTMRYNQTERQEVLSVAVPIEVRGRTVGFTRLAIPESGIAGDQNQLRNRILLVSGLTALAAILLSTLIAYQTTKPLVRFLKSTQELAEGSLEGLLDSRGYDEISQLTHAFNNLVRTLRDQIRALQSEREKLSAVLQQMTDGVIIVNAEDEIELINPAAERLFKTGARNVEGHSAAEILRQHQWIDLLHSCREKGKEQAQSLELPGKDIFLQGIAIPLGESMPDHTLLLFQDLTRIKRLETTRQDFISNISHELRTPLAALKALTETLQSGALEDPPAAGKFLTRMETEVDALAQMVAELLELSRIESGQVPLELQDVSVHSIVEEAVERMREQAHRRKITIHMDLPDQLPKVKADPRRIEQVLVNLIHNAIKFSGRGGTIHVGARVDRDDMLFFVRDQGIGIPAADLHRIFERFYKTDQARSSGGTGLGLAISKHLIEVHKGKIWAESELNQGSTFYFSLPLAHST
ncbi:MAG: ATP-binding protein [Anaerolineales bacterium]